MDQIIKKLKRLVLEKTIEVLIIVFGLGFAVGLGVGIVVQDCECSNCDIGEQKLGDDLIQKDDSEAAITINNSEPREYGVESSENDVNAEVEDICADVSGAVSKPGVYCAEDGSMIIELIEMAGGFELERYAGRYTAQDINLSQNVTDGMKIYIPFYEEVECKRLKLSFSPDQVVTPSISSTQSSTTTTTTTPDSSCVDINSATKEQLIELEGVGESTSTAIIENRPYTTNQDLLNVSGIGESKYNSMKDSLCELE